MSTLTLKKSLPVAVPGMDSASPPERTAALLVVRDHDRGRSLAAALGERDVACRIALEPAAVLQILEEGLPAALVMEPSPSDTAEDELVRALRSRSGGDSVPVVALTPGIGVGARADALRWGARLVLDRDAEVHQLAGSIAEVVRPANAAGARIVCLDDDPDQLLLLDLALRHGGHDVACCSTTGELDEALADGPPDLFILDVNLGGRVSGLDVAKALRQDQRMATVPIVHLTGCGDSATRSAALRAGCDDFLEKPFSPAVLLERVDARLARARQLRVVLERDALTGLLNRAALLSALRSELRRHRERGLPATLALLDLDHFKTVNDRLGHLAGDQVLRSFARLLSRRSRAADLVGRLGGEEFAVLLGGCEEEPARRVVDELRAGFAGVQHRIDGAAPFHVTFSAGLAPLTAEGDVSAWLGAADEALYAAKDAGRNRVVVAGERLAGID